MMPKWRLLWSIAIFCNLFFIVLRFFFHFSAICFRFFCNFRDIFVAIFFMTTIGILVPVSFTGLRTNPTNPDPHICLATSFYFRAHACIFGRILEAEFSTFFCVVPCAHPCRALARAPVTNFPNNYHNTRTGHWTTLL